MERAKCNVFRLHLDPAWTNDPSSTYTYSGSAGQPADAENEADIRKFNPSRLKTFLTSLYWPLMQKAMNHGMYVVVRPPGVCPGSLKVGDYYQQYLLTVWDIVTQNTNILNHAGQISIELANEPVSVTNAQGIDDPKALHDYFQPVVDKIRANGFTGIIWVPGTGWQANYTSYASYPIEGNNIGYAVHDYCGWYGSSDDNPDPQNKIRNFHNQVPVVDTNPIIITEVDWSPENPDAEGHYNEHGDWVVPNYGTWATGSTSKWGAAFKAMLNHFGNISMTLSSTACLFDIDRLLADGSVVPAFGGLEEACGKACMDWYAEYYNVDWPHADDEEQTAAPLAATSIVPESDVMEVKVGGYLFQPLTATYQDGSTYDVAPLATYQTSAPDIVMVNSGIVRAIHEGSATVTASYKDKTDKELTASYTVRATFFPFAAQYINTSLFAQGTYDEATHTFHPGQWGQMGWEYPGGADMSDYKYLVIQLAQTCSQSHLNIFTEGSIWSPCCSTPDFGSKKQIVLNLQTAKYTSDGNKKGQPLDTRDIRIVCFWGNGGQTIEVSDMYLTNNDDYTREEPSGVNPVITHVRTPETVWSLSGQRIRQNSDSRQSLQGLPSGIYIVGNKKTIIR